MLFISSPKSVQIAYSTFKEIIWVLESLDIQNYDEAFQASLENVLVALKDKEKSLEMREAYAKYLTASDEEKKSIALANYLSKKER